MTVDVQQAIPTGVPPKPLSTVTLETARDGLGPFETTTACRPADWWTGTNRCDWMGRRRLDWAVTRTRPSLKPTSGR